MKKNYLLYALSFMLTASVFTACSDDDDPVVSPVEETVYTDATGLQLTYNDAAMLGKQITYTPNVADVTKATITLAGEPLNLTAQTKSTEGIASPGIIPGEASTTLNVENVVITGDKVTFTGTDEANGRTITYTGEASADALTLNLSVELPATPLDGTTWNVITGENNAPIHILWDADPFMFMGNPEGWDMQSALNLIMMMTKIEEQTIPQMLCGVLKSVSFLPNGNIQAEYKDSLKAAEWLTSPLNIAMYTANESDIRLYLNPGQIIASATKSTKSTDPNAAIAALIQQIAPMLGEGIPLTYKTDEQGAMIAYLDETTLLPLLQTVAPMFEDEAFVNMIVELLKAQAPADMAGTIDLFLKPVLVAIPEVVASTRSMEIGLKLTPNAN
ncbi:MULTISPECIES: DUF4925 domain-containing protein [unclassified Carboxylicivirga]|uniref:DUF4925 domain-containing protein n=1 Tax=Carboxylicivirga TaxID=1628153 RepID=UPI003D343A58